MDCFRSLRCLEVLQVINVFEPHHHLIEGRFWDIGIVKYAFFISVDLLLENLLPVVFWNSFIQQIVILIRELAAFHQRGRILFGLISLTVALVFRVVFEIVFIVISHLQIVGFLALELIRPGRLDLIHFDKLRPGWWLGVLLLTHLDVLKHHGCRFKGIHLAFQYWFPLGHGVLELHQRNKIVAARLIQLLGYLE